MSVLLPDAGERANANPSREPGYSPAHQLLHWLTALCMFGALPLAWLMRTAPEDTPFSYALYRWHETVGLLVLALTAYRIALRFRDPPPPLPASLAPWDRALAHVTYVLFYAVMIFMPVTGLITTYAYGYPPKLFNLIDTPALIGKDERLAEWIGDLHAAGQWPVYALIVVHIAGVVFQLVVVRSGVLGRMLPAQSLDPSGGHVPALRESGTDRATKETVS